MDPFDIDICCLEENEQDCLQLKSGNEFISGSVFSYDGDYNKEYTTQRTPNGDRKGSILIQDSGAWWSKSNPSNKWTKVGSNVYGGTYNTVIKKLSPNDTEIFFRINSNLSKIFRWEVEVIGSNINSVFKLFSSTYGSKDISTYVREYLGDEVDIDIDVYLEDNHIILKVTNNEDSTLLCTSKVVML